MFEITSSMVEEPTDISFHKITKPDTTNTLMGKKLLVGSRLHLRSTFVADGFPRCSPSETCSHFGTDDVHGQIPVPIFASSEGYYILYIL